MLSHLDELPIWPRLSEAQRRRVAEGTVAAHFDKGTFLSSGSCMGMIHIVKGSVRVYLLSEDGREVTLFRIGEGDTCVMSASCAVSQISFEVHMTVERDCDILLIPSSVFNSLADENIYVKCYMYEVITERFSSVVWTLQQILFKNMDRRLAEYLIHRYEESGSVNLPATQEQIAVDINSAREVVARMLKRFAEDGLVETKRGTIVLKDIEALRALE